MEGLLSETQEEDREREMHVGRVILDVGEYLLCGRKGVDSYQIFFCSFLCENLVISFSTLSMLVK